jgi:hypothetical protein
MVKLRALVQGGRLKLDAAVDLPENTAVDLIAVPVDQVDPLDDEERRALDEAIEEADAALDRGHGIPAEKVLAEIRALPRA